MKKLLITLIIILLALPLQASMQPYFTNSSWMNKTNFYNIYDAIVERYSASELPNYTYIPNYYSGAGYPIVPTNRFWAYNYVYRNASASGSVQYYPEANEQLYELVTKYCQVTNLSNTNGLFNQSPYTNIANWSHKSMYEYLRVNFTNVDGTIGVGIYTNYPSNSSTNWFWTKTWQTNEWQIELGSLTFTVTNIYWTNNIRHIQAGWKYSDADRIVRKPLEIGRASCRERV